MQKTKQPHVQTRSMTRQNAVDNVTQRMQRVSTSEEDDPGHRQKNEEVNLSKKHKISSAGIDTSMTSKKLRHEKISHEQLVKTTRAVLEKLLQKETKATPNNKKSRKAKRKSRSEKSPIACTFSEAGQNNDILSDTKDSSSADKSSISEGGSLHIDFSGDFQSDSGELPIGIEADGCGPDHSAEAESDSAHESTEEQIDKETVREAAKVLRDIGDAVNDEVTQKLKKAAIEIVKKKAYKAYKDTLKTVLDTNYTQPMDQLCEKERYQIAIVSLLTEKTIAEAKRAMASKKELNSIKDNAVSFIAENFPSWLNPWI